MRFTLGRFTSTRLDRAVIWARAALRTLKQAKAKTGSDKAISDPQWIGHRQPAIPGPEIMVYPEGYHYIGLQPEDIPFLVEEQFLKGRPVEKFLAPAPKEKAQELGEPTPKEIRVVLRNCGKINPENIEDYIAEDGYEAIAKVITECTPDDVLEIIKASGMRGRGGAGFPTWLNWNLTRS